MTITTSRTKEDALNDMLQLRKLYTRISKYKFILAESFTTYLENASSNIDSTNCDYSSYMRRQNHAEYIISECTKTLEEIEAQNCNLYTITIDPITKEEIETPVKINGDDYLDKASVNNSSFGKNSNWLKAFS